ncbi:MAG: alpha/beta fold hydrolase [Steroidobacteraceae bacterium]
MPFDEKFYRSRDGLQLCYRDYAGAARKAPMLCLHGLTRNSRDFAALAEHIAPARRVIVPDQRGRGRSQYDSHWLNYHPGTEQQWRTFARLAFDESEDGVPRLAADPKIGDAIRSIPAPPGAVQALWLAFGQLRAMPALAFRGAHSDVLSAATFERMQREVPSLVAVTVPNRGHAPQLDEPDSLRALDTFLSGLSE